MSERSQQRDARREALRLQCAQQRVRLAGVLEEAQDHLRPIDHALAVIRSVRRTPLLLSGLGALATIAATVLMGRRRSRESGVGRAGHWTEWLAVAGPMLQPLLSALQRWWGTRQAGHAHAPVDESLETPHPDRR